MADMVKAKKGNQTHTFVRTAFERVWKDKGWTEVTEGNQMPQVNTPPPPPRREETDEDE